MKKFIALLLGLMLVISMAACGTNSTPAPTPSAESKFKDTIVVSNSADAQSLDPQVQNDTTSEAVVRQIYSTLIKFDTEGKIIPDLAESWSVSADGKAWTFKLKKDVKFHNGTALTAAAVKASYERIMAPNNGLVSAGIVKMFEKVEAPDATTVVITTKDPYGPMLQLMCNASMSVMDPEFITKYGSTSTSIGMKAESVNGTGPYKLASWKKDQELKLERFDGYFGVKALTKNIVYRPIPEAASRVVALETGEVDLLQATPAAEVNRLEKDKKYSVMRVNTVGQRLFRFGCNDPIIKDTKVRQALNIAIDRQLIIDALFPGVAYAPTAPLAPITWGYANLGEIKQDKEKAKQLLKEAGYPNGFKTKIVTTERYVKGKELAEVMAAQLAEIGVIAEIKVMEWSAIVASWNGVTAKEFDEPMFIMGAGPSMMDADGGLRGLYTTSPDGKNDRNYGFYSNAEVDKLVDAGMKETDLEKRKALYKRAEEILFLEDPAGIWLFNQKVETVMTSKLKGVRISGIGAVTYEAATLEK